MYWNWYWNYIDSKKYVLVNPAHYFIQKLFLLIMKFISFCIDTISIWMLFFKGCSICTTLSAAHGFYLITRRAFASEFSCKIWMRVIIVIVVIVIVTGENKVNPAFLWMDLDRLWLDFDNKKGLCQCGWGIIVILIVQDTYRKSAS